MSTESVPTVSEIVAEATAAGRSAVPEIVAEAVAAGRASADDSVATILEREGFIVGIPWPSEHAVDDHPGRVGESTSYIACEPLTLADAEGGSRNLGVGDVLHVEEVRVAGTVLAGLVSRHQVVPVPSDRGVIGLASALYKRIDRLEQLLADLHGAVSA